MEMKENRGRWPHWCGCCAVISTVRWWSAWNSWVSVTENAMGGVSLHAVRRAASLFAPDHAFARFLYGQNLRELLLSAFVIADPLCSLCRRTRFLGEAG